MKTSSHVELYLSHCKWYYFHLSLLMYCRAIKNKASLHMLQITRMKNKITWKTSVRLWLLLAGRMGPCRFVPILACTYISKIKPRTHDLDECRRCDNGWWMIIKAGFSEVVKI